MCIKLFQKVVVIQNQYSLRSCVSIDTTNKDDVDGMDTKEISFFFIILIFVIHGSHNIYRGTYYAYQKLQIS